MQNNEFLGSYRSQKMVWTTRCAVLRTIGILFMVAGRAASSTEFFTSIRQTRDPVNFA